MCTPSSTSQSASAPYRFCPPPRWVNLSISSVGHIQARPGPVPFCPKIAHSRVEIGPLSNTIPGAHIASQSIQLFLQGSRLWQTDRISRLTDRPCYSICSNRLLVLWCGLKHSKILIEAAFFCRTCCSLIFNWSWNVIVIHLSEYNKQASESQIFQVLCWFQMIIFIMVHICNISAQCNAPINEHSKYC